MKNSRDELLRLSVISLLCLAACGAPPSLAKVAPPKVVVAKAPPAPMDFYATVAPQPIAERSDAPSKGEIVIQVSKYLRAGVFSPDGKLVAVSMGTGIVALVDARTYQVRAQKRFWVRRGTNVRLAFDQSGSRLLVDGSASMQDGGDVFVWDLHRDEVIEIHHGYSYRGNAAISPDGMTVVWAAQSDSTPPTDGSSIFFHDLSGKSKVRSLESPQNYMLIHFDPSGKFLYLVTQTRKLEVRDATSGALVGDGKELEGTVGAQDFAIRPNGGAYARVHSGNLELRNPSDNSLLTPEIRPLANVPAEELPSSVAWSPNGERVLTWNNKRWTAYDAQSQKQLHSQVLESGDQIQGLTNDGLLLAAVRKDSKQFFLNPFDGTERKLLWSVDGSNAYGPAALVAPNGASAILSFLDSGQVAMLDLGSNTLIGETVFDSTVEEKSLWGIQPMPGDGVMSWARSGVETWTKDGPLLTKCNGLGQIKEIDGVMSHISMYGVCPLTKDGAPSSLGGSLLAMDSTARYALLLGPRSGRSTTVVMRDLKKKKDKRPIASPLDLYCGDCTDVAVVGKGGKSFAYVAQSQVVFFGGAKKPKAVTTAGNFRKLWQSQDQKRVFGVHAKGVTVFDWKGREKAELSVPVTSGVSAAKSSDSRTFAIASEKQVALFEQDGSIKTTVDIDTKYPPSLQLSGDGRWLLLQQEGKAWLVDTVSGTRKEFSASTIDMSPDDTQLARCEDQKLLVMEIATGTERSLGYCRPRDMLFTSDAKFIAMSSRVATTIVRIADGKRVVLQKIVAFSRKDNASINGSYWLVTRDDGAYQTNAPLELLARRGAGPITSAAMEAPGSQTDKLLESFFAGQ